MFTGKRTCLHVASGDYGFHNKTEDWLANGHRGSPSYGVPMALGRVLPRLAALRYCGEVSMGLIYGGIVTWRGSRDIRWLVP